MVCAHCGSESHHTGHSACAKYCTLCKEPGHRQKRAGCKFRVCSKCGASGHTASECNRCSECGSTTHKSALSFACPEHKCTNCEGTLEPKGHNRNDCPRMQTSMCEECGEIGHSANKCPIRPCNACGLRSHKLQTSHLCPEHVCTLCNGEELPKGHNHNICPRAECQTCKLFGHVAKDCVYANCLDVDVDWFNLLVTKSESTVQAYFAEVSVQAISLRTDGIVRTVTSWDLLQDKFTLSANQLMEIKRVVNFRWSLPSTAVVAHHA